MSSQRRKARSFPRETLGETNKRNAKERRDSIATEVFKGKVIKILEKSLIRHVGKLSKAELLDYAIMYADHGVKMIHGWKIAIETATPEAVAEICLEFPPRGSS